MNRTSSYNMSGLCSHRCAIFAAALCVTLALTQPAQAKNFCGGRDIACLIAAITPNNGAFNSGCSAVLALNFGSRATFRIHGNSEKRIGYRAAWPGIANVYIDDVLKFQL